MSGGTSWCSDYNTTCFASDRNLTDSCPILSRMAFITYTFHKILHSALALTFFGTSLPSITSFTISMILSVLLSSIVSFGVRDPVGCCSVGNAHGINTIALGALSFLYQIYMYINIILRHYKVATRVG